MICHICGAEIPDDSKVCELCGAELTEEPAEEMAEETVEETADAPAEDDFDPRAFAGLDETCEFDPRAFAGLDTEQEQEEAPAEEAPVKKQKEKKKRKPGAVAALVIAIVLVVLAAAAGVLWWLTMPAEEAVLVQDFTANAGLEEGETVTGFVIDLRETDRIGLSDAVWCSVVTETENVRRSRTYLMAYELTKEGWVLSVVDGVDTAGWLTEPLSGITAEELQADLVGQELEPEKDFTFVLTEEDLQEVEILSQTTDLDAGTDQVEAAITVTNDVLSWTVNAQISCSFEESWNIDELENAKAEIDYKPGMDFELEQEDFLAALYENPIVLGKPEEEEDTMEVIAVVADGEKTQKAEEEPAVEQEVLVTEETVSNFSVKESRFSLEEDRQLVDCSFELIKDVAQLYVEATVVYVYDGGWKVDEVRYDAEVEEIILTGTWNGTYTESEGKTPKVTVKVEEAEDGTEKLSFAFSPSEATPTFPTGSYALTAKTDPKTMGVELTPGEWIVNPWVEINIVGLKGVLMIEEGVITDGKTFTITLDRPEPAVKPAQETEETAQPAAPAANTQPAAPAEKPQTTAPAENAGGLDLAPSQESLEENPYQLPLG